MDERNQLMIARGIGITLALIYIGLIASAIWKYVSTQDIANSTWEIIFIVMIPASIAWFARKDESLTIPRMMSGETIPTEPNVEAKRARKSYYLKHSVGFAIAVLILTIISTFVIERDWQHLYLFTEVSPTLNIIIALSLEFLISIIVFFAISYVWEEHSIKKYNRKLDELED